MFFTQPYFPKRRCSCDIEGMLKTATPEFRAWWKEANKLENVFGFSYAQAKPTLFERLRTMFFAR